MYGNTEELREGVRLNLEDTDSDGELDDENGAPLDFVAAANPLVLLPAMRKPVFSRFPRILWAMI